MTPSQGEGLNRASPPAAEKLSVLRGHGVSPEYPPTSFVTMAGFADYPPTSFVSCLRAVSRCLSSFSSNTSVSPKPYRCRTDLLRRIPFELPIEINFISLFFECFPTNILLWNLTVITDFQGPFRRVITGLKRKFTRYVRRKSFGESCVLQRMGWRPSRVYPGWAKIKPLGKHYINVPRRHPPGGGAGKANLGLATNLCFQRGELAGEPGSPIVMMVLIR